MLYSLCYEAFPGIAPVTDDDKLLAGARRLDSRALAEIHDRYYPGLHRYLIYRTGDDDTAADLASEVFMRLLDNLHAGKSPDSLNAWLFGVANHLVADHFRRQARRPQVALSDDLPGPEDAHNIEADKRMDIAAVRAALRHLTEEQQQVLALRFDRDLSIAEAAALMKKSETAVKQLQFRAVAALRRKLEGWND